MVQSPGIQARGGSAGPAAVRGNNPESDLAMSNNGQWKECLVVCKSSQDIELRGSVLRLTRFSVAFEVYNPHAVLRTSEVLSDFRILVNDCTLYSGRAVVSSVVHTGAMLVCEAKLSESGLNLALLGGHSSARSLEGFRAFLGEWHNVYKVRPEFKVVIADMQTFLNDLRLWLDQVELEIRCDPAGDRAEEERRIAGELGEAVVPAFDALHERLEALSETIEAERRLAHQAFAKRQLHPLMLCSPFAWRAFHKPLGYAGDYEMVSMILRNPLEGGSIYAKVVNLWFLSQWPARAHRNRIAWLKDRLVQESLRMAQCGRPLRVLNLGCGPAAEVERFLAEPLADRAEFTLWDFNEETLEYAASVLGEARRRHGRHTAIQIQKKSVHHVLKEGQRPVVGDGGRYDYIYCAGLFDYLSDRTCRQLMSIFYDWLAPGGLLAATNVAATKPFRHMLEFVLDWHLIHRDAERAATLMPEQSPPENRSIKMDPTGVNLFMEVRKPDHA